MKPPETVSRRGHTAAEGSGGTREVPGVTALKLLPRIASRSSRQGVYLRKSALNLSFLSPKFST